MTLLTELPPEVPVHLTDFLYKPDIPNIVLTCRLFHQHYAALLWREVLVKSEGETPTLNVNTLQAHAKWVRSLKYTGPLPAEYFDVSFPSLRALSRVDEYSRQDITQLSTGTLKAAATLVATEQDICWARLVTLNPSIEKITLELVPTSLSGTSSGEQSGRRWTVQSSSASMASENKTCPMKRPGSFGGRSVGSRHLSVAVKTSCRPFNSISHQQQLWRRSKPSLE
ncbi:hypothetical protein BGW39_011467 [Mortierella sp. 14UC]|nr:hypothetical protein BGW39_011467 [Mortierella sp. 14UC]